MSLNLLNWVSESTWCVPEDQPDQPSVHYTRFSSADSVILAPRLGTCLLKFYHEKNRIPQNVINFIVINYYTIFKSSQIIVFPIPHSSYNLSQIQDYIQDINKHLSIYMILIWLNNMNQYYFYVIHWSFHNLKERSLRRDLVYVTDTSRQRLNCLQRQNWDTSHRLSIRHFSFSFLGRRNFSQKYHPPKHCGEAVPKNRTFNGWISEVEGFP